LAGRAWAKKAQPAAVVCPEHPQPRPDENNLDHHYCYLNIDGDEVHQPAKSLNGSVPAGAAAQCRDGDYSFSEHHAGSVTPPRRHQMAINDRTLNIEKNRAAKPPAQSA
jgi:hypothetical protein